MDKLVSELQELIERAKDILKTNKDFSKFCLEKEEAILSQSTDPIPAPTKRKEEFRSPKAATISETVAQPSESAVAKPLEKIQDEPDVPKIEKLQAWYSKTYPGDATFNISELSEILAQNNDSVSDAEAYVSGTIDLMAMGFDKKNVKAALTGNRR